MDAVFDSLARAAIPFFANVGILALLSWTLSVWAPRDYEKLARSDLRYGVLVGLTFGAGAAVLMNMPIEFEPGIFGDARGAPILLAGAVGGPVGAALTTAIAVMTRFFLGGAGAAGGILYICAFGATGLLVHFVYMRRTKKLPEIGTLLAVATIVTALTAFTVFLVPEAKRFPLLITIWPKLWAANMIGIAILGGMLQKDFFRRAAELETIRQGELASRAAHAKSDFLASMSHEIRTPLNGILGILQILERDALPVDAMEKVKTARSSGFFLLSLINQVLDGAKIEAGHIPREKEAFSLAALVESFGSMFAHQAASKGLAFEVDVEGEGPDRLVGEFNNIRQILFNLIGNAIKFTEKGQVRLIARKLARGDGTVQLTFAISDTGCGIPEENLGSVFDEFVQSKADGATHPGGTGLGLSICRRIANEIGATLSVRSEVGTGSTFSLSLDVDGAAETAGAENRGALPNAHVFPLSVLVAEDNVVNQMVVAALLERDGHRVRVTSNGKEALEVLEENPDGYDVVLMDVQMPVMDGVEATRTALERIGPEKLPPIIALTANAFADQRAAYLEAGMTTVLSKPINIAELSDALTRHVRPRAGTPGAGTDIERPFAGGPAAARAPGTAGPDLDMELLGQLITRVAADDLKEMVEELRNHTDRLVSRLAAVAISSEEHRRCIHELRGLLGNFGLVAASRIVGGMERTDPGSGETGTSVEHLREVIDRSLIELTSYFDRSASFDNAHRKMRHGGAA